MAKFWAPKLATEVIHACLLTIGHIGYSSEHKVGQRLRDVIGLRDRRRHGAGAKLVIPVTSAAGTRSRREASPAAYDIVFT